jgi:hypothetical protein
VGLIYHVRRRRALFLNWDIVCPASLGSSLVSGASGTLRPRCWFTSLIRIRRPYNFLISSLQLAYDLPARMIDMLQIVALILEVMFGVGVLGSAVVVVLSFIEDIAELGPDREPEIQADGDGSRVPQPAL